MNELEITVEMYAYIYISISVGLAVLMMKSSSGEYGQSPEGVLFDGVVVFFLWPLFILFFILMGMLHGSIRLTELIFFKGDKDD